MALLLKTSQNNIGDCGSGHFEFTTQSPRCSQLLMLTAFKRNFVYKIFQKYSNLVTLLTLALLFL